MKTDIENTKDSAGADSSPSPCSAVSRYGLSVGEEVLLRCVVSAIRENCVVSVRPRDMAFPSADLNVHRNDILELPNEKEQLSEGLAASSCSPIIYETQSHGQVWDVLE